MLNPGKTVIERDGAKIQVYGRERMLVELMRASASMAPGYYAELIGAYRRIADGWAFTHALTSPCRAPARRGR